jgi:hypothetical protein
MKMAIAGFCAVLVAMMMPGHPEIRFREVEQRVGVVPK